MIKVEPGQGRALSSNAKLLKWLDQHQKATVHRNTSTNLDHELGFASILYQTCLQLFGEIWKRLKQDRRRPRALQARTRENLSRLVLWGDFLDHGRLDACLDRSTEIRDCVLEVFHDIGKTLAEVASKLVSGPPLAQDTYIKDLLKDLAMLLEKVNSILGVEDITNFSSESEESETEKAAVFPDIAFDKNMDLHVTCLTDLSPTLERMANDANLAGEDPVIGPNGITFHVNESAKQYVLQVHDKFRDAPKALVERLGEANWQRFVRIRGFMQEHEQDQEPVAAKSAFAPLSKFHDSGLGSSIRTRSHFAASIASHSSFVSTEADTSAGRIRVPPTPEEVGKGLPFKCFICGHVQSKVKNRIDWKLHVFQDLQPYICTFDDCRNLLVTFPTRKLWSDHEFIEHRIDRFLKCHDCSERFQNEDVFIEHLRDRHGNRVSRNQLAAMVSAAKTSLPTAIDNQNCPLCLEDGWKSQRNFATHVGRHMEDIALACLPKDTEDEGEGESSEGEDRVQPLSFLDLRDGVAPMHYQGENYNSAQPPNVDPNSAIPMSPQSSQGGSIFRDEYDDEIFRGHLAQPIQPHPPDYQPSHQPAHLAPSTAAEWTFRESQWQLPSLQPRLLSSLSPVVQPANVDLAVPRPSPLDTVHKPNGKPGRPSREEIARREAEAAAEGRIYMPQTRRPKNPETLAGIPSPPPTGINSSAEASSASTKRTFQESKGQTPSLTLQLPNLQPRPSFSSLSPVTRPANVDLAAPRPSPLDLVHKPKGKPGRPTREEIARREAEAAAEGRIYMPQTRRRNKPKKPQTLAGIPSPLPTVTNSSVEASSTSVKRTFQESKGQAPSPTLQLPNLQPRPSFSSLSPVVLPANVDLAAPRPSPLDTVHKPKGKPGRPTREEIARREAEAAAEGRIYMPQTRRRNRPKNPETLAGSPLPPSTDTNGSTEASSTSVQAPPH